MDRLTHAPHDPGGRRLPGLRPLCEYCFHRFQPPSCPSCVVAWTMRRRTQLLLPLIWFFGVLGLGCFYFLQPLSEHQESLTAFWIELGCTYVLASVPTGWKIIGHDDADAETLALAVLLGPIVAPFRIAWIIGSSGRRGAPEGGAERLRAAPKQLISDHPVASW
jgi:hypothetical protein